MSAQHTPGPWLIYKAQRRSRPAIRNAEGFYVVEHVTDEANARLIAAAPEMLEALKACWDLGIDKNLVPMVRAAITKATS